MKKKLMGKIVVLSLFSLALVACQPSAGSTSGTSVSDSGVVAEGKTVSAIEMVTLPTKTTYFVDDIFDIAGASVNLTYEDGTDETVSLPSALVNVSNPNMHSAGSKTVIVTPVNGATNRVRATFRITVSVHGFSFVFDYNYEGADDETVNVTHGNRARRPEDPTREGYTFYDWFQDENCTMVYDFDTPVTADTTIYACWKDNTKTYCEATYDFNYYGVAPQRYTQIVESGQEVRSLPLTPERDEFSFNGWFQDEGGTSAFDFDSPITGDTTIYGSWTKTKTGSSTYVFEAEQTDLSGKVGPGYSGEAVGAAMIINDTTQTASGGKAVSFLYKNGLSVDFYIAASEDTEVTFVASLAQEFNGITLTDETYQLRVSHDPDDQSDYTRVSYGSVSLSGTSFIDTMNVTLSLTRGYNLIQLVTCNSVNPNGEGNGTFAGTAPVVDCIKLTTEAVLSWDQNKGLPANV